MYSLFLQDFLTFRIVPILLRPRMKTWLRRIFLVVIGIFAWREPFSFVHTGGIELDPGWLYVFLPLAKVSPVQFYDGPTEDESGYNKSDIFDYRLIHRYKHLSYKSHTLNTSPF